MRLVHTSDWHLGQRLHEVGREFEHARFLRFLLNLLQSQQVDALIVAGDLFDSANPSAEAQRLYYEFLAACLRRLPALDVVILGGNHDSPARLDAPAEVLRALRVHVLGGLPRQPDGAVDVQRAVVPLHRKDGGIGAWLAAVPYLRPVDLPVLPEALPAGDAASRQLLAGVREIYDQLFAAARARRQPGQALLASGHCLLSGGETSVDSERKIQLGNTLPLPVDLFPSDVVYVALGHLHRAQQVGEHAHIRYAGSPIPLALSEQRYPHQVVLVELDSEALRTVQPVYVPRSVDILSVPPLPLPLPEVLPLLRALPQQGPDGASEEERPLLEVRVQLGAHETVPNLRRTIEDAVATAWPRLVRITSARQPKDPDAAAGAPAAPTLLRDLDPEEVFAHRYRHFRADANAALPEAQLTLFRRLLEQAYGPAPSITPVRPERSEGGPHGPAQAGTWGESKDRHRLPFDSGAAPLRSGRTESGASS